MPSERTYYLRHVLHLFKDRVVMSDVLGPITDMYTFMAIDCIFAYNVLRRSTTISNVL